MSFGAVLTSAEPHESGLALSIPADWHQGRTAYGGFSAALALAAAATVARPIGDDLPPLRSIEVGFVGPLAGEVVATARVLRQGRNATWVAVEITSEGKVGLTASLVFMRPVESRLQLNRMLPPQGLIPPEEAAPFDFSHAPAFRRQHFEVRFALPRSEEKRPELCWWVRLRDGEGLDPFTVPLLCADALPPGVMPLLARGTPISSMHWHSGFLTGTPRTRDGWWLLRSAPDHAGHGCSSQRMELWNADGEPVIAGMQSVALFG